MTKFLIIFNCLLLIIVFPLDAGTIYVSEYEQLNYYASNAQPGDTILIANGTYNIQDWALDVWVNNIIIKSQSGIRDSVILNGDGMYGSQMGMWINANHVTISDITIQNVGIHCIQTNANIDNLQVLNCVLKDAGEQIVKVPRSSELSPSENGIIENCLFEYSAQVGPQYYIGGIVCHFSKDWIIRNNIFKYIKSPDQTIAEHAIHFWNESENILVEKNLIINCDRGIGFGLGASGNDGGIIRNNMIYHNSTPGDVGIALESSPKTQVYNNSIFIMNNYYNAIEYRFSVTQNVYIVNNLTNKIICARNNATGIVENNITDAIPPWFIDVLSGNLHLSSDTLSRIVDQGTDVSGLVEDFDGDIRPQGFGIDIGADEYTLVTEIENKIDKNVPSKFFLHQNYPNPFNPETTISFEIPETGSDLINVNLSLYNMLGQKITTLLNEPFAANSYEVKWYGKDSYGQLVPSGVYFYILKTENFISSRKMMLIK